MALLRSIATVSGFTMISRITGFARDILLANFLGAGLAADAFFVAFKFPNLFRRFFGEGAVAAAFVPLFSTTLEKEGRDEARLFAERAFAVMGVALGLLVAVMMIIMPFAMVIFAPGFLEVPGKHELATELTRITFPYLLLISLCALLSGLLNALGRFAAAAAAPIILNLTLMAFLVGASQIAGTPAHALAWGVSAAGVLQLVWLLVAAKRAGMAMRLRRPTLSPRVRTLIKRIIPVAFGAGIYQISLLVDTILASLVAEGAVSWLYYADRVNQLPLGVVGTAIGVALLPLLSRQLAAGRTDDAMQSQNRAVEFTLLLTLPAMAGLIVLAEPIISVLFQRGAFSAADAQATAAALAAFSLGLPGYVLVKVLSPGFYAREDTKTPVIVASSALAASIVFNVILMQFYGHVGIALGTALGAMLNGGTLWLLLRRRAHFHMDARLLHRTPRILAATLAMAGALWGAQTLAADLALPLGWGVLGGYIALALAVYFGTGLLLGAVKRSDLGVLKRLRRAPPPSDA